MKMKGIAMTSSCNRTSKDKHCDLFIFFFLARLKISVDSRNYNLCVETCQRPILACPAWPRLWHARHSREFSMPGMSENLACPACRGFCWVWITYYYNLGFSRTGWEGHRTSNYAYRACEILLHANFNGKLLWGHPLYYQWANHWR